MQTEFELTPKQAEYIKNAHHRWNIACGAVRSGKSYCQIAYCIPSRLVERRGKRGLRVILGATRANIERNILQPMRDIYGDSIASGINSQNYCKILGEKVYCIGADNVRQVAKIRGSEIAYCAIDEATDINEEVFEMLKSRLSLPWSCCDVTTNPSNPSHWFKEFIDSKERGVDIYYQHYTIYDNPFLPEEYVKSLEREYEGTVYYGRYIEGEWTQAEGLIYPMYIDAIVPKLPGIPEKNVISLDYGTMNAFAAILWSLIDGVWYGWKNYYYSGRDTGIQKTDDEYLKDIESEFVEVITKYRTGVANAQFHGTMFPEKIRVIIDPSAASFIALLKRTDWAKVWEANNAVLDGIHDTALCMQLGKIKIVDNGLMDPWIKEAGGYSWDDKAEDERPIKINDHDMDATRYFVKTMHLAKEYAKEVRRERYRDVYVPGF